MAEREREVRGGTGRRGMSLGQQKGRGTGSVPVLRWQVPRGVMRTQGVVTSSGEEGSRAGVLAPWMPLGVLFGDVRPVMYDRLDSRRARRPSVQARMHVEEPPRQLAPSRALPHAPPHGPRPLEQPPLPRPRLPPRLPLPPHPRPLLQSPLPPPPGHPRRQHLHPDGAPEGECRTRPRPF